MAELNKEEREQIKKKYTTALTNIRAQIESALPNLEGKPVSEIKDFILTVMQAEGLTPERIARYSKFIEIKKINESGKFITTTLDKDLDKLAQRISDGKEKPSENSTDKKKKPKSFNLVLSNNQKLGIMKLEESAGKNVLESLIRTEALASGFTEEMLQKPLKDMKYNHTNKVNAGGKPYIKAITELMYNVIAAERHSQSFDSAKNKTENNLEAKSPADKINNMIMPGDEANVNKNGANTEIEGPQM